VNSFWSSGASGWHRLSTYRFDSIGQIGGGKLKQTGIIDVAIIQSLYRKGVVKDLVAEYGLVVVDECHHLAAFSFEQVMRKIRAKYVTGLSATPVRKDGHDPIIYMQCGPIRFNVPVRSQVQASLFEHRVIPTTTGVRWNGEAPPTFMSCTAFSRTILRTPIRSCVMSRQLSDKVGGHLCFPEEPNISIGSVYDCGNIAGVCSC